MIERIAAIALAAALCAAGGAWAASLWYSPRLELAEQRAENVGQMLREQNRGIDALKQAGEEREHLASLAQAEANARAKVHEVSAQRLLSMARPVGVDECLAVRELIREELKR